MQTRNPYVAPTAYEAGGEPLQDESLFPCACGDPACIGDGDDPQNIRLGKSWYAADCQMANNHPVIVEERERASRADVIRDDDHFNQVRR